VNRRKFITLVDGAAATWPRAARAQQSRVARIGALYIGLADAESLKKELQDGLRELGYMEGQNIAFEFRSAEGKLGLLRAVHDSLGVADQVPSDLLGPLTVDGAGLLAECLKLHRRGAHDLHSIHIV
jgi:hypothetical protein